ncbi:hypothetical protein [Oenococcus sp.]|uniref:hypothetical protein n=1 Tax=Oenococcus sp. TaxID=1979414 RepID=UPI0039EA7377
MAHIPEINNRRQKVIYQLKAIVQQLVALSKYHDGLNYSHHYWQGWFYLWDNLVCGVVMNNKLAQISLAICDYILRGFFMLWGISLLLAYRKNVFLVFTGICMVIFNLLTMLFDRNYHKQKK